MNKIKSAFDGIKANDEVIHNTLYFLEKQREKKNRRIKPAYRYAAVMAAVLIVMFGIGGYSVSRTAVSYISIDVNPSVELSLNRFDNVIAVSAYNDGGAAILENLNLTGKYYTDAIYYLLSDEEFAGYIKDDDKVVFTVVSDRENEIINGIEHCGNYSAESGVCHAADREIISGAHEHGLSFGKYRAYTELAEYDPSITAEDCRDMTMHEIHCLIDEHRAEESDSGQSGEGKQLRHGEEHGGHHGNQ